MREAATVSGPVSFVFYANAAFPLSMFMLFESKNGDNEWIKPSSNQQHMRSPPWQPLTRSYCETADRGPR